MRKSGSSTRRDRRAGGIVREERGTYASANPSTFGVAVQCNSLTPSFATSRSHCRTYCYRRSYFEKALRPKRFRPRLVCADDLDLHERRQEITRCPSQPPFHVDHVHWERFGGVSRRPGSNKALFAIYPLIGGNETRH